MKDTTSKEELRKIVQEELEKAEQKRRRDEEWEKFQKEQQSHYDSTPFIGF